MMHSDEIYMSCHCEECERNRRIIIREFLKEWITDHNPYWTAEQILKELEGEE